MAGNEDHEEGLDEHSSSPSATNHQDEEDKPVPYTPYTYKAFDALHQFMNHITSQPRRSAAERQAHKEEVERQRALLPEHQAHSRPGVNEETLEDVMRRVLRRASLQASIQADIEDGTLDNTAQEDLQEDLINPYLDTPAFVDAMEVLPDPDTSNDGAAQSTDSQYSSSQESTDSISYHDSIEYIDRGVNHDEQESVNVARYDQSVRARDHTVDDEQQSGEVVDNHHESIQTSAHDVESEEQESEAATSHDPNIEISDDAAICEEQESSDVISDHGSIEISDVVDLGDRAVDRNERGPGEAIIDYGSIEVSEHVVDHEEANIIDDEENNRSEPSPPLSEVESIEQREQIPIVLPSTRVAGHGDTALIPLTTDSAERSHIQTVDHEPPLIKVTPPSREAPPASTVKRPSPGSLLPVPQVIKLRARKTALQSLRITAASLQETSPLTTTVTTLSSATTSLSTSQVIAPPPREQSLSTTGPDRPSTAATRITDGFHIEPPIRAWSTYELPQLIPGSLSLYMPGLGNLPTSYTVGPDMRRRRAARLHTRTRQDECEERHFAATVSEELRRGGLVEPWI